MLQFWQYVLGLHHIGTKLVRCLAAQKHQRIMVVSLKLLFNLFRILYLASCLQTVVVQNAATNTLTHT